MGWSEVLLLISIAQDWTLMTLSMHFWSLSYHITTRMTQVLRPLKECIIHSFDIMYTYLCKMVFVAKTVDHISLQIRNGQSLAIKCSLHPGLRRICTEVSLCAPERGLLHQYPTRTIPCTFQSPATKSTSTYFRSTLNVARSGSMLSSLQIHVISSFKAIQRSFCEQESCHGGFPVLI